LVCFCFCFVLGFLLLLFNTFVVFSRLPSHMQARRSACPRSHSVLT
jgi:hypothetical protein